MAGNMLCQAQLPAFWNQCGLNNICFTLMHTVRAWLKQSSLTIHYLHSPPSSSRDINSRGRGGRSVKTSDATVLRWEDYKEITSKYQHELLPCRNSSGKHWKKEKKTYPNANQPISIYVFLFFFLISVELKVHYWIYWIFLSTLLHKLLKQTRCMKIKTWPLQWR